jgi:hypothetical protein
VERRGRERGRRTSTSAEGPPILDQVRIEPPSSQAHWDITMQCRTKHTTTYLRITPLTHEGHPVTLLLAFKSAASRILTPIARALAETTSIRSFESRRFDARSLSRRAGGVSLPGKASCPLKVWSPQRKRTWQQSRQSAAQQSG